jgi:hypothetical protein
MSIPHAYCIDCGIKAAPTNPEEPDPLRWRMPRGWVLVPQKSGNWGRRCCACNERERQRYLMFLRSSERMPLVLQTILDFWRQYPERQLCEVIALAAQLRRTDVAELNDCDLAAVLRIWTLSDADRAFEKRHGLSRIDPWSEVAPPVEPQRRSAG